MYSYIYIFGCNRTIPPFSVICPFIRTWIHAPTTFSSFFPPRFSDILMINGLIHRVTLEENCKRPVARRVAKENAINLACPTTANFLFDKSSRQRPLSYRPPYFLIHSIFIKTNISKNKIDLHPQFKISSDLPWASLIDG